VNGTEELIEIDDVDLVLYQCPNCGAELKEGEIDFDNSMTTMNDIFRLAVLHKCPKCGDDIELSGTAVIPFEARSNENGKFNAIYFVGDTVKHHDVIAKCRGCNWRAKVAIHKDPPGELVIDSWEEIADEEV